MSDDSETTLETPGLDKLIRAMKAKAPSIRIGILGAKSARDEQAVKGGKAVNASSGKLKAAKGTVNVETNAEVGAIHEFGSKNSPQRSFLRVPIADNLGKEMERSGALDKASLAEVIKGGSILPWAKKIAVIAEGIVAEAFKTGGFGKWVPSNMKNKKVHDTLVETQQLRNSITSEVKE